MTDAPDNRAEQAPADVITSAGEGSLEAARERRKRFAELTVEKRELKARERAINDELADLEERLLDDYAELGTDSMRADVGEDRYTLYLSPDLWAGPIKSGINDRGEPQATDDDWSAANDALRAAGLGDYLHERFNVQSFSSWLRGFRDEHGPNWRDVLPDELIEALNIDDRMRVRMVKGAKKK